ncbi:MAG: flagellar hook-length control protein FliK [Magnetospirillum sp.]|nr:flagellar hook-length control protein FliK [Magnetospirillum sp.]
MTTITSINKKVLEQANMTLAGKAQGQTQTAEQAFAAALARASSYSLAGTPQNTVGSALSRHLERKASETTRSEQAEKPQRPEAKTVDKPKVKEAKAPTKPERAEQPQAKPEPRDTAAAPSSDAADGAVETRTAAGDSDPSGDQQTATDQGAGQAADTGATAVDNTQAAQATTGQMVGQVIEAKTDGTAAVEIVADDAAEGQAVDGEAGQAQTRQAADAGAEELGDAFDATLTATAAKSTKTGNNAEAEAAQAAADLASQQADDLAAVLAGSGAALKVQVKVNDQTAAQSADLATADAAATLIDAMLALDPDSQPVQTGAQTGQGQSGGQGTDTAGQQVGANGALSNAQAAEGRAEAAKPFLAALAAQLEAGNTNTNQTQSAQGQNGPSVAGLNGAGGVQGTQKAAPTQAAQAPQAPRHIPPQQVIDQVTVQIDKAVKDGQDTIKVQLKPVELGRIEVKLEMGSDGKVTGTVTADRAETLQILQKDARGLEKALQDAGLKAESGSLSFNLRGEQQQNANDNGSGRSGRGRRPLTGIDATAEGATAAGQSTGSGRRSGVDIVA